jgi:CRP-like cAMP-binding protein
MVELTSQPDQSKLRISEFFRKQTGCRSIKVAKNNQIYTSGQCDGMVYFVERGWVKLVLDSQEGKECLLAIRSSGEIFGELCLSGQIERLETAVAMQEVTVKQMPHRSFLIGLNQELLLEDLVKYLAACVAEQQEITAAMATDDGEHRLARTLLYLSQRFRRQDSRGACIEQRISHKELSEMVGTTRPRIGIFLKKFRELGLVRLTEKRCLVIEKNQMEEYITGRA